VVGRLVLASLLAVAPLGAATIGKGVDGPDIFLDVVVKNRFFRPSESAPVISVRSRDAVWLDCVVYDRANRPVGCYSGPDAITNQFKITLGQLPAVDRGIYSFCLVARNQDGHQLASYPKIRGGGEIIQIKESAVDAEHKQVTYMLPKAACVRLRAGFRDGLYLSPIVSSLAPGMASRYATP